MNPDYLEQLAFLCLFSIQVFFVVVDSVGGGGGGIFDDLDDGVIGQPIAKAKTEFPGDHHHHDHDGVMEDKYLPSVTLNITDGGGEGVPKQESPEDDIMADLMAAAANAGAGDSETERKIKLDPDAPFNPGVLSDTSWLQVKQLKMSKI